MINMANIPKAYSEVYCFINALGNYYTDKIPLNIYNTIKNNRDITYNPEFQKNQKLETGMISNEALSLIAALNLQYWCNDKKQMEELKRKYIDNTKKEEEKYSASNLFKNRIEEEEKGQEINKLLVEYRPRNFIQRFFERLINIFKRK